MPYQFNPHRHVKIWLSKNPDVFLNLENRVRLVKMRDINPKDIIHFVYDSQLLTPKALEELRSFCTKYKIMAKDVRHDVMPKCSTQDEKNLLEIYEDNIIHLQKGGNVAVGSDILRWLSPVYKLGTYTDFDVQVNTRKLPKVVSVKKPLLISAGSIAVKGDVEAVCLNNDTISVVDYQEALPFIEKIQRVIYANSVKQPIFEDTYIDKTILASQNSFGKFFPSFLVELLMAFDPNYQVVLLLVNLCKGRTAREVHEKIINDTADNFNFSKNVLDSNKISYNNLSESEIISKAAALKKAEIKQLLGWICWLISSKSQYKQIQATAAIQDDNQLLTQLRERIRMSLLKTSVVYTSGPVALIQALFQNILYKKGDIDKDVAIFSFAHYGLDKAFISKNIIPLHATAKAAAALMSGTEIGKFNDLSWLQEGQNATAVREQKIIDAQSHMPQDFQDMRKKIEDHIKKIQADLLGCFGFYRHKSRQAKIQVLQEILTHFDDNSFDVKGFNETLKRYRTVDVAASIGNSQTMALIKELWQFSRQAKYFMLTDEHECTPITP